MIDIIIEICSGFGPPIIELVEICTRLGELPWIRLVELTGPWVELVGPWVELVGPWV